MQHHMPYGYQVVNGSIMTEKGRSEIVQRIFHLYIKGWSLRRLAMMLTEKEIADGKGKASWTHVKVGNIISNRKYMGDGDFPRIISPEEFEQARLIREQTEEKRSRGSRGGNARYFYSGKIVCGVCGATYHRYAVRGKYFWRCQCYVKDNHVSCRNRRVDDMELEESGGKLLKGLMTHPEQYKSIRAYHPQMEDPEILELDHAIIKGMEDHAPAASLLKLYMKRTEARYHLLRIDDTGHETERIRLVLEGYRQEGGESNEAVLKDIVSSITVDMDGGLQYKLANGIRITIK